MLISGNRSPTYLIMLERAGNWLLGRRVTDPNDLRFGLFRAGFRANGNEDLWCSTEHQCSVLQALQGLAALTTGGQKTQYEDAVYIILNRLKPVPPPNYPASLYDSTNKRYFQGVNRETPAHSWEMDTAWALDCTTWAGTTVFTLLGNNTVASDCRETAANLNNFLETNKIIVQSSVTEKFNLTYSLPTGTYVDGFKPYKDTPLPWGYQNSPSLVWSEGTLGYIQLCMLLGLNNEAIKYMDETIKLQNCNAVGRVVKGILYVTETFADEPWEMHVWESVTSSAWLYLLINNPKVLFPSLPFCSVSLGTNSLSFSSAASAVANRTSVAFTHPPLQLLNTPASWITGIQLPASSGGQLQFGVSANTGGQRSTTIQVGRDSGCNDALSVTQASSLPPATHVNVCIEAYYNSGPAGSLLTIVTNLYGGQPPSHSFVPIFPSTPEYKIPLNARPTECSGNVMLSSSGFGSMNVHTILSIGGGSISNEVTIAGGVSGPYDYYGEETTGSIIYFANHIDENDISSRNPNNLSVIEVRLRFFINAQ